MPDQAVSDPSAPDRRAVRARPDCTSLDGYRRGNDLSAAEAAAVPLFQRLRIASRACYVTDSKALAATAAWMQNAFSE